MPIIRLFAKKEVTHLTIKGTH